MPAPKVPSPSGARQAAARRPVVLPFDVEPGEKPASTSWLDRLKREARTGIPGAAVSAVLHAAILIVLALTVIFREQESGGEVIRQMNRKGGILTAQICVLDDISRSPGEALNVLLRVLNERKYGGDPIPLLTAIATGNPTKEDYYNEPLDPANLDRFTLQMKTLGLVGRNHWEDAAQVVDLYASVSSVPKVMPLPAKPVATYCRSAVEPT